HAHLAFKVTIPYNPEQGGPIDIREVEGDDIRHTVLSYPTMTFSFTSYSRDSDECLNNALKAFSWFKFYGVPHLKQKHIIVEELYSVTNRDVLLDIIYERRQGFDVVLRVPSRMSMLVPTIERVIFKEE